MNRKLIRISSETIGDIGKLVERAYRNKGNAVEFDGNKALIVIYEKTKDGDKVSFYVAKIKERGTFEFVEDDEEGED